MSKAMHVASIVFWSASSWFDLHSGDYFLFPITVGMIAFHVVSLKELKP